MTSFFRYATFFSLLIGLKAFGLDTFAELKGEQRAAWAKLMHFGLSNGHYRAKIESADFYLSANRSVEEEFAENLRQFLADPVYVCKFPARAVFLKPFTSQPVRTCTVIEEWKQKIAASSISLVYVSQYVSNPASVFGHTFLLVNSNQRPPYLHVTINNAAEVPNDTTALDYMISGLGGGFKATNFIESLAVKAQEYSNIENRDMWVYELEMSPAEINQLLNHLWELEHRSKENYYFLTGNCSSYLINMLAAVLPDVEFQNPYATYFLPVSSTKRIESRVRKVSYLPALRNHVSHKLAQLNPDEIQEFQMFLEDHDAVKTETTSVQYLESVIFFYDFLKSRKGGVLSETDNRIYNQALLERSQKGSIPEPAAAETPARPDYSYEPIRAAFNFKSGTSGTFSFAPFYHSSLQKHDGFIPFSEVVVLDTELAVFDGRPKLVKETFLALTNFVPTLDFDPQYSWAFSLFLQEDLIHLTPRIGKSYQLLPRSLFYALVGVDINGAYVPLTAEVGLLAEYKSVRYGVSVTAMKMMDKGIQNELIVRGNHQTGKSSDIEFTLKWNYENVYSQTGLNYFF